MAYIVMADIIMAYIVMAYRRCNSKLDELSNEACVARLGSEKCCGALLGAGHLLKLRLEHCDLPHRRLHACACALRTHTCACTHTRMHQKNPYMHRNTCTHTRTHAKECTCASTHARTHARTQHARTHAHKHARTHKRTYVRTHARMYASMHE